MISEAHSTVPDLQGAEQETDVQQERIQELFDEFFTSDFFDMAESEGLKKKDFDDTILLLREDFSQSFSPQKDATDPQEMQRAFSQHLQTEIDAGGESIIDSSVRGILIERKKEWDEILLAADEILAQNDNKEQHLREGNTLIAQEIIRVLTSFAETEEGKKRYWNEEDIEKIGNLFFDEHGDSFKGVVEFAQEEDGASNLQNTLRDMIKSQLRSFLEKYDNNTLGQDNVRKNAGILNGDKYQRPVRDEKSSVGASVKKKTSKKQRQNAVSNSSVLEDLIKSGTLPKFDETQQGVDSTERVSDGSVEQQDSDNVEKKLQNGNGDSNQKDSQANVAKNDKNDSDDTPNKANVATNKTDKPSSNIADKGIFKKSDNSKERYQTESLTPPPKEIRGVNEELFDNMERVVIDSLLIAEGRLDHADIKAPERRRILESLTAEIIEKTILIGSFGDACNNLEVEDRKDLVQNLTKRLVDNTFFLRAKKARDRKARGSKNQNTKK